MKFAFGLFTFRLAATAILAASFLSPASAQPAVDLQARYWFTTTQHRLQLVKNDIGSEIRLKDDLGLRDRDLPEFRVEFRSGPHAVQFDYFQITQRGDQDVSRRIEFNGRTYVLGTRIESELSTKSVRIGYAYRFRLDSEGRIRLGPSISGAGVWLDGSLTAPNLTPAVSTTGMLSLGFPILGASFRAEPSDRFVISADAGGMTVGSYGSAIAGEASVLIRPIRRLGIGGGYRALRYHPKLDPEFAVIQFAGPFLSAGVQF